MRKLSSGTAEIGRRRVSLGSSSMFRKEGFLYTEYVLLEELEYSSSTGGNARARGKLGVCDTTDTRDGGVCVVEPPLSLTRRCCSTRVVVLLEETTEFETAAPRRRGGGGNPVVTEFPLLDAVGGRVNVLRTGVTLSEDDRGCAGWAVDGLVESV